MGFIENVARSVVGMLRYLHVYVSEEHVMQLIGVLMIFLLVIWLIHRIENREAKNAIYKNFPFFREAADNLQSKIDHVSSRIELLEEKVRQLEKNINSKSS